MPKYIFIERVFVEDLETPVNTAAKSGYAFKTLIEGKTHYIVVMELIEK